MENNPILYLVLGFMGFVIFLAVIGETPDSQVEQPTEWVQPAGQDYGTIKLEETKPDWTLSIPEIDFEQQMLPIVRQGANLPVPDSNPGYYSETEGNLFIVGHNGSAFNRLAELPKKIYIYRNNSPNEYSLKNFETLPAYEINMDSLLEYQGIVVMTCAGEKLGGNYTYRLILYYS